MPTPRQPLSFAQEWFFLFCCLWFTGGLFLDGWAHNHVPELETFFTPWHGVFYAGYALVTGSLLWFTRQRKRADASWMEAIPAHYEYALLGCAIFLLGGVADLLWHELLGVEANLEALLSPTHLILGIGMVLILSGPLRSWWRHSHERVTLTEQLPLLLSLTLIFSSFTFLTQYAHFVDKGAGGPAPVGADMIFHRQAIGFLTYQMQTFLLMGCVFFAMRRTRLAFGFLTVMLTVNVAAMALMREHREFIAAALMAGLIGDSFVQIMYIARRGIRVFAFLFPAVLFGLVMLLTAVLQGIWWSSHMWTGAIVLPGMAGLILSFVAWPLATDEN